MKNYPILYNNISDLTNLITENKLNTTDEYLVRVVSSDITRSDALQLANDIKLLLPNSVIVGMTSCISVLFKGDTVDRATMIIVEEYSKLTVRRELIKFTDKTIEEFAKDIHSYCTDTNSFNSPFNILFPATFLRSYKLVSEINKLEPKLLLTGGTVGNMSHLENDSFVFTENGVYDDHALLFSACGEDQHQFSLISHAHDTLDDNIYTITEVDGEVITKIDNEIAGPWILNKLNLTEDQVIVNTNEIDYADFYALQTQINNDYLAHFPIIFEEDDSTWYMNYNNDKHGLNVYSAILKSDARFKLGFINPAVAMQNTYKMISEVYDKPVESIFTYTCIVQRVYLSNCAKWSLSPFHKLNICGAFMLGEIYYENNQTHYCHGVCVVSGVSENDKYFVPDLSELEKVSLVQEDIAFTLKAMENRGHKADLVHSLNENSGDTEINSYLVDAEIDVPNMLQYKLDLDKVRLNKVCVIEIQTADATIAYVGNEQYNKACKDLLASIKLIFSNHPVSVFTKTYSFNYKSLVIACLDCVTNMEFVDYCKDIYHHFGYSKTSIDGITMVLKTVVVLNQDDPISAGMKFLFSSKDSMENFLIYSDNSYEENTNADELNMLEVINRAIAHDLVTPYYQGLYNNDSNKIDKYESLMRIVDLDGTVYTPYTFLGVAQKYKLYPHLSRMMIEKVLEDFANKTEQVSINLAIHDINSIAFKSWFFHTLENYEKPESITIEFLESDDITTSKEFYEFVDTIKKYGCKIAIDDFGSGYSTFSTLLHLEPNYIKIDGSIIKKISSNDKTLMVLDTISYMTNKLGAKTVAEFVENEEIQEILTQYKIDYSQGYHFSIPSPIDKIK